MQQEKVEALLRMAAASPGLEVRVNERYERSGPSHGSNGPPSAACSPHTGLHPGAASLATSRLSTSAAAMSPQTDGSPGVDGRCEALVQELRARLERLETAAASTQGFLQQVRLHHVT